MENPNIKEVVVISDVHLGTYGAHAKELLNYLQSIETKTLIINGDFIDIWQFRKNFFPASHLQVIKKIIEMASAGTKVVYITGNHDEMLRKFTDIEFGNIEVCNKKILEIQGKKIWIFHGDVFDHSVHHSKWIAKLGGYGYDFLIRLNALTNFILAKLGKEKYSFSKKIKSSVKKAVKFIGDFEAIASELAVSNQYDAVICGHIHQPCIKSFENHKGKTQYMNSGDWVENLSALELDHNGWKIFQYNTSLKTAKVNVQKNDYKSFKSLEELVLEVTGGVI
jgi:UDP-2,3-diacylglucosamine pyrophosphatase LpxH